MVFTTTLVWCQVVMAEWLARQTPKHKIMGLSPAKASWLIKKRPAWAMGDGNGASSLSRKWVPGDRNGNCTVITRGACIPRVYSMYKRVYSPQGVEQVMDVTGLPGVIICKALWVSFGKEKALYKNCILLLCSSLGPHKKVQETELRCPHTICLYNQITGQHQQLAAI